MSEELTVKCIKCSRVWTARQLETDGGNCDTSPNKKGKTIRAKRKTKKPNPKQTLGPVMHTALPEEIDKMANHDHISDTTLTLPHIQRCLEDMIEELVLRDTSANRSASQNTTIQLWFTCPELSHPLIKNHYYRSLHPLVGPFLRGYLSNPECFDNDDDEMGHLSTLGLDDARTLARDMVDSWNHCFWQAL